MKNLYREGVPLAIGLMMLAGTAWATPDVADGPLLGRLFLTPETRAQLERQRRSELSTAPYAGSAPLRLDGVVIRSAGAPTVWINQQAHTGHLREREISLSTSSRQPGKVTLSVGATPAVDLNVGATFNPATGEQRGALPDGGVRVRPVRQP